MKLGWKIFVTGTLALWAAACGSNSDPAAEGGGTWRGWPDEGVGRCVPRSSLRSLTGAGECTASGYGGRARVVQADVPGLSSASAVDTGNLPSEGGTADDAQDSLYVPALLKGEIPRVDIRGYDATCEAHATVSEVRGEILDIKVTAEVIESQASATCDTKGIIRSGETTITGLRVGKHRIDVTGEPNQTVIIDDRLKVVVNEQLPSGDGLVVRALHISALECVCTADVIVSSSEARVTCTPGCSKPPDTGGDGKDGGSTLPPPPHEGGTTTPPGPPADAGGPPKGGGGSTPGGSPGTTPGGTPGGTPSTTPGAPGGTPGSTPGGTPGTTPGGNPGSAPGGNPGGTPGGKPGSTPGGTPGTTPGGTPGGAPGGTPGTTPGGTPGGAPGSTPGSTPGGTPGGAPGSTPGGTPGSTSGAKDAGAGGTKGSTPIVDGGGPTNPGDHGSTSPENPGTGGHGPGKKTSPSGSGGGGVGDPCDTHHPCADPLVCAPSSH